MCICNNNNKKLLFKPFLSGPNQVQTFLTEHGGPGIQHIGLHTSNITEAVATLKDNGVTFINPPSTYYSEVSCKQFRSLNLTFHIHGLKAQWRYCVVLWIKRSRF